MKKNAFIGTMLLIGATFLASCGGGDANKAAEVSCGKIDCATAPLDPTASDALKAVQKQLVGKWEFLSVRQLYKATNQASYNTAEMLKANNKFCFASKGGVMMFVHDEAKCSYCYHLTSDSTNTPQLALTPVKGGNWCTYQIEGGAVSFAGDSLIISVDDKLQAKRYLYYRAKN